MLSHNKLPEVDMDAVNGEGVQDAFARLQLDTTNAPSAAIPHLIGQNPFRDVTEQFRAASKVLNVGQLVKDPNFTLFEAVGALEIMDPKMDSGLLKPGEEDTTYDVLQPRLPDEIIGILDQLLSSEMSWHNGSALSQTVFTCLYIDRLLSSSPKTLTEAQFLRLDDPVPEDTPANKLLHLVMRAYCLGLVKCCDIVNRQVLSEHIYEEEDFVTQTYNVPLLEMVNPDEISALLTTATLFVDSSTYPKSIKMALNARLNFRKQFLAEVSRSMDDLINKRSNWDGCISSLSTIGITRNLGKPVQGAFSTTVQRKLASTVPPRPMVVTPFEEAFTILSRLCKDAKEILRILEYKGATNLMTFCVRFTARKPQPSPYVRSLLQTILCNEQFMLGSKPIKAIIFDDLRELCLPADDLMDPVNDLSEAPNDTRFQIARRMDWFVERAGQSYIALYRTICQNRSRLRRNLCHSIVDWDGLQIECEEIDTELQSMIEETPQDLNGSPSNAFSLSSWVYHYKLRQMEWVVFLGFELEIYLPHEFAGMYWYLQYFLRTRLQHLERIRHFVHPKVEPMSALASTRSPSLLASGQAQFPNTMALVNFTLLEAAALQELCSAMIYLYTTLSRLGLVKTPPQPYSTDSLRYELRMKPFLTIGCPEVIPYDDFKGLVETPDIDTAELLEMAAESCKEGRKNFDLLGKMNTNTSHAVLCEEGYRLNLRECLRSCIGAGVAVAMLQKAVKMGNVGEMEAEIDQGSYHPWFPVPRIASTKRPPLPAVPPARKR